MSTLPSMKSNESQGHFYLCSVRGNLSNEQGKTKKDGTFPREQVTCIFLSERKAVNMYEKLRDIN